MTEYLHCDRCDEIINSGNASLMLEAEGHTHEAITFDLCQNCEKSFWKWMKELNKKVFVIDVEKG